ncbi:MAG: hypothetical protein U0802_16410 [Candidatus Binatia bacterium]
MLVLRPLLVIVAAAALTAAARVAPARGQGRPDCAAVLHQLHRTGGRDGAGTPDADRIAAKLGTDGAWVEHCAAAYGRRVKPHERKQTENDEGLTAKAESREYQEVAREERGEPENYAQGDPDNYKDRDRLRGIDPDSSAEWEPYLTHEWSPYVTHEWSPYILDDDDPGVE